MKKNMLQQAVGAQNQSSLETQIAAQGLRMTNSRRIIAKVLQQSSDHPNVEEIHKRVSALDKNISIATVYRTLKLFHQIGLLDRHDFNPETSKTRWRYEPVDKQEHYHLIDVQTGKIIEFESSPLDKLQKTIAQKYGYQLHSQKIELYGVSIKNRNKKSK